MDFIVSPRLASEFDGLRLNHFRRRSLWRESWAIAPEAAQILRQPGRI
jgi:hypothetical protein